MFERIRSLRSDRVKLVEQNNDLLKRAATDKRSLTPEELSEFDKREADANALKETIEREERALESSLSLSSSQGTRAAGRQGSIENRALPSDVKELRELQIQGITAWARGAETEDDQRVLAPLACNMGPQHQRAIGGGEQRATNIAGTANLGGYSVPQGFFPEMDKALKMFGSVEAAGPRILNTDGGADMPMPGIDDTSNTGELLTEIQDATELAVTLSQATLKAYWFGSKEVPVSWALLEDSAFSFDSIIAPILGERIGRIMNSYFTTASVTSQPKGIVPESALGATTAAAAAITYAEWLTFFHSMDPAYRAAGIKLALSDAALKMFRVVVDGNSRPLFRAGGANDELSGAPDKIDTVPIVINQDMAVPASAAKSCVLFYPQKYVVRRVRNIELYRVMNDTASVRSRTTRFVAYARGDGRAMPASAGAFKYLTHT